MKRTAQKRTSLVGSGGKRSWSTRERKFVAGLNLAEFEEYMRMRSGK